MPDPKEIFDKIDYVVVRLLMLVLLLIGAAALVKHAIDSMA